LPRVLAICRDPAFCQKLAEALESEIDFRVSVNDENNFDVITLWRAFRPELLILEAPVSPALLANIAALKLSTPETPLFLITDRHNMQSEKEALAHGVDAVFAKTTNFSSLIMNARAICGHH
jgi:DNA-binding response OmpR family regulator